MCTLLFQQLYSARYQISKQTYIHLLYPRWMHTSDVFFENLKFFGQIFMKFKVFCWWICLWCLCRIGCLKKSADGFGIHSVYARTPARVPPRMIKYPGQYAHLARIPPRRINYPGHPDKVGFLGLSKIPHALFFPPQTFHMHLFFLLKHSTCTIFSSQINHRYPPIPLLTPLW